MIVTYGIMFVCDLIIPMRVTEEEEHAGLDISFHNETYIDRSINSNRKNEPTIPPLPVPLPYMHPPSINGPTISPHLHPSMTGPIMPGGSNNSYTDDGMKVRDIELQAHENETDRIPPGGVHERAPRSDQRDL